MSSNRGGFFSLNRLLGRKNKKDEKNPSNDFQKSSLHTLTRSITNLEVISPQNKIQPLTTKHKAPFEQTFRLTVYLPHGQLYVARMGAKTKLVELLDTICTDKLLDPNKFDFRHPADDEQIFDLDFTIGEVGLNEIKLTPKNYNANNKDDAPVKYRSHAQGDYRLSVRPQTMSSVSPYSSTNSLNSSDSSGVIATTNARNSMPPLPQRKKRAAPRPPSQNSIPEDREEKCAETIAATGKPTNHTIQAIDENDRYESNLVQRNFHVSSPNLTVKSNATLQLAASNGTSSNCSSPDTSLGSSFDGSKNTDPSSSKEQSILVNGTGHESKGAPSESTVSVDSSRNHSRTSSEASDITKDVCFHESKLNKKRVLLNKKKAPAPPPRAITPIPLINNLAPVPTPRSVQPSPDPSNEVKAKIEQDRISENAAEQQTKPEETPIETPKTPNAMPNVSKVMLNVEEPPIDHTANVLHTSRSPSVELTADNIVYTFSQKITNFDENRTTSVAESTTVVSQTSVDESIKAKLGKKISVVDIGQNGELSIPANETKQPVESPPSGRTRQLSESDQEEVSHQIDQIIEKAVEINQTTLNGEVADTYNEINNNKVCTANAHNGNKACMAEAEEIGCSRNTVEASHKERSTKDTVPATDAPIKPVLNETQTFDFQEYSDQSLPASTTTTVETPSTGPESLITSDIEDGYKGNDNDNMCRSQLSREEFIESQFGFLSEHMDSKTSDSECDDKIFNKCDVVSSTMVNTTLNDTQTTSNDIPATAAATTTTTTSTAVDKNQVINELTNIINGNRFDTFIKPTNEQSERIDVNTNKRSTLSNFQISAYTNGNHKNVKVKISPKYAANETTPVNAAHRTNGRLTGTAKRLSLTNGLGVDGPADECDKNDALMKPINRSMSFHATQLAADEHNATLDDSIPVSKPLSSTPRSASYVSLIGLHKAERQADMLTLNCGLNGTRHKSSSELSIADSPTLQSIEIMKSILSGTLSASFDKRTAEIAEKKKKESPVKPATPTKEEKAVENSSEDGALKGSNGLSDSDVSNGSNGVNGSNESNESNVSNGANDTNGSDNSNVSNISKNSNGSDGSNGSNGSNGAPEVETVKLRPTQEKKTWKYQGPPAVNLSTWGERPKSQVYIKSDNDYIFGGSGASKMAALQKRFSVSPNEDKQSDRQWKKPTAVENDKQCDNGTCKLPIVRGVEYKKNVVISPNIGKNSASDAIDSIEQVVRPSYEISRIVTEKPFAEKTSFAALNRLSSVPAKIESKPFSNTKLNAKIGNGPRTHENDMNGNVVNGNGVALKSNGDAAKKENATVVPEKPLYAQFNLRKTGFKEKILDNTPKPEPQQNRTDAEPITNGVRPKSNPIPTAPKPPPILKKPTLTRPVSMFAQPVTNTRDELMDSIRNFNRNALKLNIRQH